MVESGFSRAIDMARVVASMMVVLLHVAAVDFHAFGEQWWASSFYDAFTRACVPIFLMISGTLLLDKQENLSVFLHKRLLRVMPPLVFWSAFYMAWNSWNGETYGTPLQWLLSWLSGPVSFHLWYLYAIVGIYLFVPFMRHIWQASTLSEKRLFLAAWVLVSAWPIAQALLATDVDAIDTWQMGSFFGYAGFLFLGAYVRETMGAALEQGRLSALGMVWGLSGFIGCSVLTMLATHWHSIHLGKPSPLFLDYLSPLVIGAAVCAFYLTARAGVQLGAAAPVIRRIAASSLGIYCLHIFVLDVVRDLSGFPGSGPSSWWTIPMTAVFVFVLTLGAVGLLRRTRFWRMVT